MSNRTRERVQNRGGLKTSSALRKPPGKAVQKGGIP